MSTCKLHTGHPSPTTNNNDEGQHCLHCLLAENHELSLQLREKEHTIKLLEERKHEAFFFLLMFFIKVYQSSHARMRKIQETIVRNNNYNIKVREERSGSTPFLSPHSSPSTTIPSSPFISSSSSSTTESPPTSSLSPSPSQTPLSASTTSSEASASDSNPTPSSSQYAPPPLSPMPMHPPTSPNTNTNNNNEINFYDEPHMMNSSSSDSESGNTSDHDLSSSSSSTPRGGMMQSPSFPPPILLPPPSIIANTHDSTESSLIKHFHHIIYENALDPVLVHDMEGWIVDANGAAVGLTGYSIEELRHKNIRELESRYVEPDPKIFEQLLNGAAFRIYGEHISKQGRVFPVEVHISLATVEGKNYVVGLFRDITEILRAKTLEKVNEVAQATNRAKNIFLATMSHELTTPLYGVMASLEILKQSSPALSDKQIDMLDCAMNSAVILKGIINDILDLSVLELGMFRISKEPFSLTQRAASAFGVFMEAAKFQSISFKWLHDGSEVTHIPIPTTASTATRNSTTSSTSSSTFTSTSTSTSTSSTSSTSTRRVEYSNLPALNVVGDPKRLQQVLMNLLSNAIKFTPRGGSVVLRTQVISEDERSCKLRMDVADTGIGLAPDQLQRVFEKFTQVQEGFTRKYSGTGLGLYISNKLVLLMGGKLTVKSEIQKGAVFTIDIRLMKHKGPLPMERISYEVETPPLVAAMAAYHRFGKKSGSGGGSSSRHRRHTSSSNYGSKTRRDDWKEDKLLKREKGKSIPSFDTRPRNDRFSWREVKLPKPKVVSGSAAEISRGTEEGAGAEKEPHQFFATVISDNSGREREGAEGKGDESDLEVEVGVDGGGGDEGRGASEPTDEVAPSSSNDTSAEPSPRSTTPTGSGDVEQGKIGHTLSVLLVEDNLVNQKVGKQLLRTLGVRDIDIANDGCQCLEMIKGRRLDSNKRMYNVILMDKQMPFLDGMEATRAIRQQEIDEGHLRIVIIALTADCRAGVDHEVLSAGMDDYLTKPVRANTLYNVFLKHGLLSPSPQPSPSSSSPPSS